MEYGLFGVLIFGIATSVVANSKGESAVWWFVYGLFLGPIGLILAFFSGADCPSCRRSVHKEATICPFCHQDLNDKPVLRHKHANTIALILTCLSALIFLVIILLTVGMFAIWAVKMQPK